MGVPAGPAVITLHGSCGVLRDQAVLLLGRPGSGKSDLLLRLIDRGFSLVADDQVTIREGLATPPPSLAGLVEVRGLGLLRIAHTAPAGLVLVLALDDQAAAEALPGPIADADDRRMPWPRRHRRLGLPMLRIDPFQASAPLKVEIALDCLAGRRVLPISGL
ncbi:HPr kinase/phosphorylase [Lichenicola sp.]|uniref:HPr kinase/phosphorylase n=1 Tax=Lichenicola sp. TaxID=2804529 RepID=UPI003AFFEFED